MNLKSPYVLRMAVILAWIAILAIILLIIGPGNILNWYQHVTPQGIRDMVSSFEGPAVLAFLGISIVRPLFFLPATPFTIASGFLFGFWQGILWSVTGTTLSAIFSFFLARYLLHDLIRRHFYSRLQNIDRAIESRGWNFIVFLRLIPVLPFDWVSYAAGISSIRFKDYLIGTIIGELPAAIVLVMLGSSLDNIGSATFYLSLGLAVLVLVVPEIVRRWINKRRKELAR